MATFFDVPKETVFVSTIYNVDSVVTSSSFNRSVTYTVPASRIAKVTAFIYITGNSFTSSITIGSQSRNFYGVISLFLQANETLAVAASGSAQSGRVINIGIIGALFGVP
ncbi:MAG: hypothetical protein WHU54_09190 [Candidatus Bathyarchaeia archaeon]